MEHDAGGQTRGERRERLIDIIRHRERFRVRLADDAQNNARLAVYRAAPANRARPFDGRRDVAEAHRAAVYRVAPDCNLLQFRHLRRRDHDADGVLARLFGYEPAALVGERILDTFAYVINHDAVTAHALGVQIYLPFTHVTAHHEDARDTGHFEKCGPHRPIRESAQL